MFLNLRILGYFIRKIWPCSEKTDNFVLYLTNYTQKNTKNMKKLSYYCNKRIIPIKSNNNYIKK